MKKYQNGAYLPPIESTYVKNPIDLLLVDKLKKYQNIQTQGYKTDLEMKESTSVYKRPLSSYADALNDSGPSKSKSKSRFYEKKKGGLMDIMGYKDNSPFNELPFIDINSNNITMEGVSKPIYAVPDNDSPIIMKPGGNYTFPNSKKVREYKMYEDGGEKIEVAKTSIKQSLNESLNFFLETLTDKEKKEFLKDFNTLDEKEKVLFYQSINDNAINSKMQSGGIVGMQMQNLGLDYLTLLANSQKKIIKTDEKFDYDSYHLDKHADHGIRLGPDGRYYNQDGTISLRGQIPVKQITKNPNIKKSVNKEIKDNTGIKDNYPDIKFYETPPPVSKYNPFVRQSQTSNIYETILSDKSGSLNTQSNYPLSKSEKELKLLELNIPDENIVGRKYPVIMDNFDPKIRETFIPVDNTRINQNTLNFPKSDKFYYDPYYNKMILKKEFK